MNGKKIRNYVLAAGFAVILFLPALLGRLSPHFGLSGVSAQIQFPILTRVGLLDGTVQEDIGSYYSEHLPGRDLMIKIRNQMIFSIYKKSPNQNVVLGKNDTLFEKEYICKYEKIYCPVSEEYTRELCGKLTIIRDKLEAAGKEMYVFITPTKVRYYEEYVPDRYRAAAVYGDRPGNYEMFTEILKEYDLKVYDSIPFVDEYAKTAEVPLFYKTGSHWSWPLSMAVSADLVRFLNENSRFHLPETTVTIKKSEDPVFPDTDIFDSMNLFTKPYDSYYDAEYHHDKAAEEGPNLFCRGGSFMGQTISPLIKEGYFPHDMYLENTMFCQDNFSGGGYFSDYSQLDMAYAIGQADVVIFEVNEAHIPVMGFGLFEYLLENPEILDGLGRD